MPKHQKFINVVSARFFEDLSMSMFIPLKCGELYALKIDVNAYIKMIKILLQNKHKTEHKFFVQDFEDNSYFRVHYYSRICEV